LGRSASALASPFASVLAEIREENVRRLRASAAPLAPLSASRPRQPQPDLRLETGAVSAPPSAARGRRVSVLPVSLVLHAAALLTMVVVPLLMSEPLPSPASGARAFFVEPVSAPPPPPPPPPPAARPSTAPPVRPTPVPEAAAFTAPVETPTDVKPEEGIDLGVPGGVPGGVEGGVPGGVVGGVVAGIPDSPSAPKAVRVGGAIREPKQLKYVSPEYPPLARKAHVEGVVILECTISPAGRVTEVRVLRGMPMLDDAAVAAVRQWVFTPTLLDGVPVPVVMTITVSFSLRKGPGIFR